MTDLEIENENPAPKDWPTHDKPESSRTGLFVSDAEMYRRLGVGPKTGRVAVQILEARGFPKKDPIFGNKRYWPAVRYFLDQLYGLLGDRPYLHTPRPYPGKEGNFHLPRRRPQRPTPSKGPESSQG